VISNSKKELVYFPAWADGRRGYTLRIRELFRDTLRQKGLTHTSQREAVLDHLLAAERHVSQEDIYRALRPRGIGRVTVFRTLKILEECGLIQKIMDPRGAPRFEIEKERPHHDHLVCLKCGTITEVRMPVVERAQEAACKKLGFAPLYHRHEMFGHCRACGPETA
jgi:Fur family ferric uptake transcriptional regulator